MNRQGSIVESIDWVTVLIYGMLVTFGWLNIYAAVYDEESTKSIFDITHNSGKQLIWIGCAIVPIIFILVLDFRFFDSFAYVIFGSVLLLLAAVLVFGQEVAGSQSWFQLGPIKFQPSEFAKFATALGLAKYLSSNQVKVEKLRTQFFLILIVGLPTALILLQGDAGTAMVFSAFILVLYREGLSQWVLIIGVALAVIFVLTLLVDKLILFIGIAVIIALLGIFGKKSFKRILAIVALGTIMIGAITSVDYVLNNVLREHQQNRVKVLINPNIDPWGAGWNITQSKIAIGSGGVLGKGFLDGTQTKFDFVPKQSTDFIFCTIGEEQGWLGSLVLIGLFMALLLRIIFLAERQKSRFARVYGYSVACIIFIHFTLNIAMTIGLFPVVGIPLPFFSYGGSSLWAFTIMLFIFLKVDAHRMQQMVRA